jgi:hypothetical protein
MIIAGGIDTNLLARGTKQQCIDSIKSIIDDTCHSGGVMLAADTPLLYAKDAIPENYKAVADTIASYGRYYMNRGECHAGKRNKQKVP